MKNMEGFLLINLYALAIIVLMSIVFFTKKRLNQFEDKLYGRFLLYSLMMNLSGLILGFLVVPEYHVPLFIQLLFNKIYLIALLLWINTLTLYALYVSTRKKNKFNNKIKLFNYFNLFNILMAVILPMEIIIKGNSAVPEGIVYMYSYSVFCLEFLFQIICVISHPKNLKNKKFIPLYILSTFGTATMINQIINPNMNYLINPVFIFIAIVMYFTIENPDVKVIGELNKNKDILEKSNEDKSNFMFRMTQEVRKPASNIENLSNMIDIKNEYVKLEDVVNAIKSNTRHISYVVNNVLDVSNIDIRKIKIVDSNYNIRTLLNEIKILASEKINNNVSFRFNVSNEMPEKLYGDPVKLKQVIMSILNNSIKYTKKGFIELNVDVLIKYDMCRLIIGIDDSGIGMDIKKVNDILTSDREVDEEELNKIDTLDVDLVIAKKIINMIGGTMMIKSEINKGTEFIITVDQRIIIENKKNNQGKIIHNFKKVLLVDDNIDYLTNEKKILENMEIDVVSTMYGMDAVDRIRTGEKYDLILLDDNMEKLSGVATFDELNKIDRFDTKVIIMLDKNKEIIKKHYLEKGFIDYILKDSLDSEIKRVVNKYLK